MVPTLATTRLLLRPMTEEDASFLYRLSLNRNVIRHVGEEPLADLDAAREVLRTRVFPQYRNYSVGRLAVEFKEAPPTAEGTLGPIGWCGLKFVPETNEFDLGYRFFEEHWGKGYATEAAMASLVDGRTRLPRARIIGEALVDNHASVHVLEKIGMRFEGYRLEQHGKAAIYVAPSGRMIGLAEAPVVVDFVPGTRIFREPAYAPRLPIVDNGSPGTSVVFSGGARVPLPTDQVVAFELIDGAARVGFKGMRFDGEERGQLVFRSVTDSWGTSPERNLRMTLEPDMVAAIYVSGALARPERN